MGKRIRADRLRLFIKNLLDCSSIAVTFAPQKDKVVSISKWQLALSER